MSEKIYQKKTDQEKSGIWKCNACTSEGAKACYLADIECPEDIPDSCPYDDGTLMCDWQPTEEYRIVKTSEAEEPTPPLPSIFSPTEKRAILKAAETAVVKNPMSHDDILRVLQLIGSIYSIGMDIDKLIDAAHPVIVRSGDTVKMSATQQVAEVFLADILAPEAGASDAKKYRLNIPDMIRREDGKWAEYFKEQNGEEFYSPNPDIPKDWLEPIDDEPVSAEEWFEIDNEPYKSNNHHDWKKMSIYSFKAGEANNEKRHRPTHTVTEAAENVNNKHIMGRASWRFAFGVGWNACKKSHNLD